LGVGGTIAVPAAVVNAVANAFGVAVISALGDTRDVQRVRVRDGVATGAGAVVRHPDGSRTELTVDARVVVAGAGIESLALLLRPASGVPRSAAT